MKLNCPRCYSHLRVPQQKIPPGGAWATCPKCHERFFINPSLQDYLQEPDATPQSNQAARFRPEAAQKLIDRLKARSQGNPDSTEAEELALENEIFVVLDETTKIPAIVYHSLVWICICATVLYLFFSFNSRPKQMPEVLTTNVISSVNNEVHIDLIRNDLLLIKKMYGNKNNFRVMIDSKCAEARVFKYFMNEIVPNGCNKILSLDMFSKSPALGYTAVATCEANQGKNLTMELEWVDRDAIVTFVGNSGQKKFEVFVITPMSISK